MTTATEQVKIVEVRTRTIPIHPEGITGVLSRLLKEKFTGKITINVGQGGVTSIIAEDIRKKLS